MELKALQQKFTEIYGNEGTTVSFQSPGRVNLIGEHTDYNGGYVFPCALTFGTYGVVRKRTDRKIHFASTDFECRVVCDLDHVVYEPKDEWANYLKGVVVEFQNRGFQLGGLDILISGNIPNGAGLSSSASIELLMAVILNDLFQCRLEMIELVKLSQHAENEFIGLKCGIMDQFAVGMGKKDHAMLLDCDTLKYEYVPIVLQNMQLILANTNKRRELADSKYNERRAQCEEAVQALNQKFNIQNLGQLPKDEFEKNKNLIQDAVILNRATHVIEEIDRTLKAVEALRGNDLKTFGKLMTASHNSLRDLYEVTGFELDTLVSEALKIPGTLGSRMTGAGFGGCTVSLVEKGAVDQFIREVGKAYKDKVGYEASFYIAGVGDGARQVE